MLTQKRSPIDVKAKWHGAKKWLISNRVNNIDWTYISRPKAVSQIQDRIPTKGELQQILDNKVTLRDKAFYLVVASAGFRLGTAFSLQVKDYKSIEELGMITVEGEEGRKLSKGKSYFTFVTPEARRLLEEYLKSSGPLNPEAPLFAKESKGEGNLVTLATFPGNGPYSSKELNYLRKYLAAALSLCMDTALENSFRHTLNSRVAELTLSTFGLGIIPVELTNI